FTSDRWMSRISAVNRGHASTDARSTAPDLQDTHRGHAPIGACTAVHLGPVGVPNQRLVSATVRTPDVTGPARTRINQATAGGSPAGLIGACPRLDPADRRVPTVGGC